MERLTPTLTQSENDPADNGVATAGRLNITNSSSSEEVSQLATPPSLEVALPLLDENRLNSDTHSDTHIESKENEKQDEQNNLLIQKENENTEKNQRK